MIFNKCLVIGEVYIIANFFIFFKNLKNKYFVEVNRTVCDNVIRGNMCVACERRSSTNKTSKFWLVTFWRSGGQKVTGSGVNDRNVTAFTEF